MRNRNRQVLALCTALAASSILSSVAAMDNDSSWGSHWKSHGWSKSKHGYISGGVEWVDVSEINRDLRAYGLSAFHGYAPTLSLGAVSEMGRIIIETNITSLMWKDKIDANIRSSMWMANAMCNGGFNLLPQTSFMALYPLAGLGVGLNTIKVRSDRRSFSATMATAAPNSTLMQFAALINLGVGSDLKLPKSTASKGIAIGVRAGYVFDPFDNTRWYSDGTRVSGLSDMEQSGGYIRVVMGSWGSHKR